MSICLHVKTRPPPPLDGFSWHLVFEFFFFQKSVRKIQVWLKCDKYKVYFTRNLRTFIIIFCWIIIRTRNITGKYCRENQNTLFFFNKFFFGKIYRLLNDVEGYGRARRSADGNIIWRGKKMRFAFWKTKKRMKIKLIIFKSIAFPR